MKSCSHTIVRYMDLINHRIQRHISTEFAYLLAPSRGDHHISDGETSSMERPVLQLWYI
jgi:hypothetical protein